MHNPKLQTTDKYGMFLANEENRIVDPKAYRYRKLKKSMQEYGFIPAYPLHCRPKGNRLEIFDGHRRFSVAKELKLPVWFVIYDDGQLNLPMINDTQQPWNLGDYVSSHAQQGKVDYKKLADFAKTNCMPLSIAASLLAGNLGFAGATVCALKVGEFEINNEEAAQKVATISNELRQINRTSRNSLFLNALTRCVRIKDFNPRLLIEKARLCPGKLTNQADLQGFLRMLEEIYNFRSRKCIPLTFLANEIAKKK